jgi:3',5'-cyclic AMP phosphodiesterase CpdA
MANEPLPTAVRLFHFSDIHFGLEDPAALAFARRCLGAERPAAIAITGDLTMRARRHEFTAACRWIKALDVPVTVEVGNHDLPYFNLFERFFAPYRRFRTIEALVERKIDLGGVVIVPLKTTARAQWRLNWSKGWVTRAALERTLTEIDALPAGTRVLVACHHPLVEVGTHGTALTRGGERALAALAERRVLAVLSGHVHDAFDLTHETPAGSVRMIGAGTLSKRIRSTPPSFNELTIVGREVKLRVRNLEAVPTPAMQIPQVPPDALPPRSEEEPVAPVGAVPVEDPPVH